MQRQAWIDDEAEGFRLAKIVSESDGEVVLQAGDQVRVCFFFFAYFSALRTSNAEPFLRRCA
jgi:hypothetical protein